MVNIDKYSHVNEYFVLKLVNSRSDMILALLYYTNSTKKTIDIFDLILYISRSSHDPLFWDKYFLLSLIPLKTTWPLAFLSLPHSPDILHWLKCYWLLISFHPTGSELKENHSLSVPYKSILLRTRMLIALPVCSFTGFAWNGLDPMLEPELREKVESTTL